MKQAIISSIVLSFVLQSSAFAQSSSAVISPAAPAANASSAPAATSTADAPSTVQAINVKYTGIYEGPTFSKHTHGRSLSGDQAISNRIAAQYNFQKNLNAGFQARFRTIFDARQGFRATSENHRFFANMNNIASYNIVSMNLTGKVILPTAISSHNSTMRGGVEVTPTFNIAPKDSRFSFAYAPQFQQYSYSNADTAHGMEMPGTYLVHNLEAAYQLSPATAITAGIYPEYYSLASVQKFTNRSNELDLGVNWDFAKGWSANPYIGTQLNGFSMSDAAKSMEIALTVSGTIL